MRVIAFFALWILAAVAFEIFLAPEGSTVTDKSELHQRLTLPLWTPLLAAFGLAQAATWPHSFPAWAVFAPGCYFCVQAVSCLVFSRRSVFASLCSLQVVMLTIAVVYFVRFSRLPSGG
jgi:hypothetical protein